MRLVRHPQKKLGQPKTGWPRKKKGGETSQFLFGVRDEKRERLLKRGEGPSMRRGRLVGLLAKPLWGYPAGGFRVVDGEGGRSLV